MYKHTQRSIGLFAFVSLVSIATTIPLYLSGARNSLVIPTVIIAFVVGIGALFSHLTIEVSDQSVKCIFAGGIIHKFIALDDVTSATPTRTTLLDGIGIHYGPRGLVYNVAFGDAVLVTMRNKQNYLLGSDEPVMLAAAIQSQAGRSA